MFVHPRQLAEALKGAPGVRRYQGSVTEEDHRDVLVVSVEPRGDRQPDLGELAARLRETTRLRVEIHTVESGTIPEDAPPIVDLRERSQA